MMHAERPSIRLVLFTALVLGDFVDVVGEALEVLLLLGNLLLELAELLILTLADGQVLAGALPALEGVTLAAGLGRSSSVAFAHGSTSGGKGSSEGTEGSRLGQGCAKHVWATGGGELQSGAFLDGRIDGLVTL